MNEEDHKRRLVLHFDVNKTILMRDPYDNLYTPDVVVADLLARMTWGKMTEGEP